MYRLTKHIAYLLLLFMRVMIPEATVLQWHHHEHTQDGQKPGDTGFKISKKHVHCSIDQLFNSPFTPAQTVFLKALPVVLTDDTYTEDFSYSWKFTFPNNTYLRGPPTV